MNTQGHKWIPHLKSAQYTVLRWMTEDGSWSPSSCSQTNTNTHTQQKVCLFHSEKDTSTIADKKPPFIKRQTVSGQFACLSPYMANQSFKTRCDQILYSFLHQKPLHETQQQSVSENPWVPWKVWTSRRYCVLKNKVLHLNSSVSQTLWPSFHWEEWKPKLQHVAVCFSR